MNLLSDTVTFYDLQKLPIAYLKDMVGICGADPSEYQKNAMTQFIWDTISKNPEKRNEIFADYELALFSHKCTISWFKVASLTNLRENIISKLGESVIKGQLTINEASISPNPTLFSIANCPNSIGENCFIARFLYQDGFYYIPKPDGNERIKKIRTLTALIDQDNGIVEVRAKNPQKRKVVEYLLNFFEDDPKASEFSILSNHKNNSENLADSLEGYLTESIGEPTLPLEDLTAEQVDALISILSVIDEGLGDEEAEPSYISSIKMAREIIFDTQEPVPFLALILAGLNRVSLSTLYDSLVSSPLYNSLSPYLTNRGGYIKFSSEYRGIQSENTIQVATISNSIYFTGNSNELAIKKIRDTVFKSPIDDKENVEQEALETVS